MTGSAESVRDEDGKLSTFHTLFPCFRFVRFVVLPFASRLQRSRHARGDGGGEVEGSFESLTDE